MAHPQEQAHAILALRFELGAKAFVIGEVSQRNPLFKAVGSAVGLLDHTEKTGATPETALNKIVQSPFQSRRPESAMGHNRAHTFDRRDIGNADLAMQFGVG